MYAVILLHSIKITTIQETWQKTNLDNMFARKNILLGTYSFCASSKGAILYKIKGGENRSTGV